MKEQGRKNIAQNRKARHDYTILDTYEAGVALIGTEVKTLRVGRASLVDAFATIDDGEVLLRGLHIPEYAQGTWTNHEPRRNRKLLLHREEIERLIGKTREGGLTLVPLALYFRDGWAKLELGLARGKRTTTSARTWPSATRTGRSRGPTGARRRGACGRCGDARPQPGRLVRSGMIRRAGGVTLVQPPQRAAQGGERFRLRMSIEGKRAEEGDDDLENHASQKNKRRYKRTADLAHAFALAG